MSATNKRKRTPIMLDKETQLTEEKAQPVAPPNKSTDKKSSNSKMISPRFTPLMSHYRISDVNKNQERGKFNLIEVSYDFWDSNNKHKQRKTGTEFTYSYQNSNSGNGTPTTATATAPAPATGGKDRRPSKAKEGEVPQVHIITPTHKSHRHKTRQHRKSDTSVEFINIETRNMKEQPEMVDRTAKPQEHFSIPPFHNIKSDLSTLIASDRGTAFEPMGFASPEYPPFHLQESDTSSDHSINSPDHSKHTFQSSGEYDSGSISPIANFDSCYISSPNRLPRSFASFAASAASSSTPNFGTKSLLKSSKSISLSTPDFGTKKNSIGSIIDPVSDSEIVPNFSEFFKNS
eukprot:TRINITY_DN19555_c0_g1_i1.p1 TRINITY_DN19555_c0_g1~~TRINITY_DN19555_c0_g1_i1.p1  ORF type:complete len:347 (-),score=43.64 TRINITY_DN19555_c0_g1_i1:63-1103(-)